MPSPILSFARPATYSNPTQYGLDYNVKLFLAAGAALGESALTGTQIGALNTMVLALKALSAWQQFDALYPIVGGTAGWHSLNLVDTTVYRMIANGTITNNANGTQGNGINGYWDTQYPIGQSAFNGNPINVHISAYSRSGATGFDIIWGATDFDQNTSLQPNHPDDGLIDSLGNDQIVVNPVPSPTTFAAAYFMTLCSADTAHQFYRNGVMQNDAGTPNYNASEPNLYFMASNDLVSGTAGFSDRQFAFLSIGKGKIPGAVSFNTTDLYNIIQTYQTSLGRQV